MGALRKTLVYLGLAEDAYDDDVDSAHDETEGTRSGGHHLDRHADRQPERYGGGDRHGMDRNASDRPNDRHSDRLPDRAAARGMDRIVDVRNADRRATVTALPHIVGAQGPMQRITAVHPRSYNDAKIIGEHFRDGVPVIMNLTEMGDADAKRLVDFAAGLVFGLQGVVERVTTRVFLLSPAAIEVMNEVQEPQTTDTGFFNQS